MYKCPYCGKELRSARGLAPHLRYTKCKEKAIKRQFEEQGRLIDAQVHRMVVVKQREFALIEQRQKMSLEIQQLADDIENEWKPLTVCNVCGGTWDNHKEDCIFNTQKKGVFDEILDFATNILTIVSGEHRE